MKPKDGFVKGYVMHVKVTMVNPLRIGSCDRKEAISGSEIGGDSSQAGIIMVAGSSF